MSFPIKRWTTTTTQNDVLVLLAQLGQGKGEREARIDREVRANTSSLVHSSTSQLPVPSIFSDEHRSDRDLPETGLSAVIEKERER